MSSSLSDYSSLFYLSPFPKWVYDLTTFEILDVNQAAIDLYGYSREEFLRLTIKDLRPKEEIPVLLQAHANISQRADTIYFGIFTHQKKSGKLIRMKIHGHKVDFADKKCMVVVCQDVTVEERQVQELQESEQRLKSASSIAKLGYWRQELDTDILTWSEEIFKIWGRDRSTFKVSFENFYESIHPDDKKAFEVAQKATFEGGKELDFIHRIVLPDGTIKWVHELARLVKDESGKPIILEGTVQDVTQQKEEEQRINQISEQLIESEANFRTIFEIASLGIAQVDPAKGNIILVNSFYETITGYTTEELLQMNFVELTHPDDRERDWEIFSKALRGEGEYRNEKRYIRKDGTIVWVRLHVAFIKDALGKPIRTVAICEDISYRKAEEQRLRLLESVVTNTTEAVLVTEAEPQDAPGPRIIYVNEAFTKMTGYSAEEVIGKSPRFLQGPKSDKEQLAKLGRALRNWEPCEITILNYKKNGEEFWINITVSPVANEKGWFTHWIAVERDVTEKKNQDLEQKLLAEISRIFNDERKISDATKKLCSTFADFGDFDFVEVWTTTLENTHIQLLSSTYRSQEAAEFHNLTVGFKQFKLGEGIPGKVWETNKPIVWEISKDTESFTRNEAARQSGIESIFGIPLLFQEELVGVMVFGSSKENSKLTQYLPIFQRLETFIGSEINRKFLETNLSHLFEAIPDIICLADFKGRFLKMNKAGYELLGYGEEELLYHSFDEFVHPEDKEISSNEVKRLSEGETTFKFENRYLTKKGEIVWLSWTCNSDLEDGVIYASAKNITSEKKLRELNTQASSLARIGSWEIDLVEGKIFWTTMVHALHETDPENFNPDLKTAIEFYREDFREMVTESIERCINEGKSFNFEAVLVTAKNKERWVRAIGSSEFLGGKCIRIYGSFQDIHDKKESENRLQSLADNLPGVVFRYVISPEGKDELKYVSKGSGVIWGFSAEECIQDNSLVWNGIKAGGDFDEIKASISESVKNRTKWTAKWRYRMPNGELKFHIGHGSPEYLTDGSVVFNSLILDITEEKKTASLLEQATSMARIGSWELDLISQNGSSMYWSPMTKQILEVEENYNPTLTGGFEFYTESSKSQIQKAVDQLIQEGKEFDEELQIITTSGVERWIRCIGQGEWVQGKCIKIFGSFQDIHKKKVGEIALQKSLKTLEDYKFSLDQSAIIAFTDNKGVITFVNENFCNISKYTEEELIGNTHQLINSKHHPKSFFVDLWKTITSGKVWRGEIKNRAKDDTYYWVDTTIVPFLDEKNKPFQYLAIRFDVTSRKLADEKSRKALDEKNKILESIGDGFFSVDKNWIVTYWNKKAEEIIGIKRENLVGYNLWEKFPEAKDLEFFRQYKKAFDTQTPVHFEEYFPPYNQWYEANGYPTPEGISVFFRDITDKKLAEEKIIKANERFEKVTEATNDAIWDWDIENKTYFRSKGIEKFFGEASSQSLDEEDFWTDKFHPEDLPNIRQSIEIALQNPEINKWESEYRIFKEDGQICYVIDKGVIIRNKKGKAVRMVGAMTDISDRKKHEEELLKLNESLKKYAHELEITNEQLEQFAFIASHDLQEPLRMISSFLDQLKRKYGEQLDDKANQYIHFSRDGAKRMKQIILDLLEYSRAGKFNESLGKIHLEHLLNDYKSLRKKVIEEKSAVFVHPHLPIIEGYRAPFTQVLHCLLDNAIKYSQEGIPPRIELHVEETQSEWIFAIRDNGIGIDSIFFDKIFIIFQRLHNRDQYEGTGIGLSIVKKQVESWGGKIWLESIPGEGSKFSFSLPKTNLNLV